MTQTDLINLFLYKDGKLFWRNNPTQEAGSVRFIKQKPYRQLKYKVKNYLIHRLVFLYHHGYLPKIVDHIDRNSINNNIENLRAANYTLNNQNAKARKNTSGCKNVNWNKDKRKWRVTLNIQGKNTFFGYYDDIELADLVATEARDKHYGDFACHAI